MTRPVGVGRPARRGGRRRTTTDDGFLALEWVLSLPLLFLLGTGLVLVGSVVRDVLVLEEAARAAARTAAVTTDDTVVATVGRDAAPELEHVTVTVRPADRRAGQHVTVTATTTVRYGPVTRDLTATSVTLVEPVADVTAPAGFPGPGWARGPHGETAASGPTARTGHDLPWSARP